MPTVQTIIADAINTTDDTDATTTTNNPVVNLRRALGAAAAGYRGAMPRHAAVNAASLLRDIGMGPRADALLNAGGDAARAAALEVALRSLDAAERMLDRAAAQATADHAGQLKCATLDALEDSCYLSGRAPARRANNAPATTTYHAQTAPAALPPLAAVNVMPDAPATVTTYTDAPTVITGGIDAVADALGIDAPAAPTRTVQAAVKDLPTVGNIGAARRILTDAKLREVTVRIGSNCDGLGCTYHDHRAADVWMWSAAGECSSWRGSFGGSYAMAYASDVSAAAAGGKVGGKLPAGALALQIARGAYRATATLYINPADVNGNLLPSAELSTADRRVLGAYRSLKSGDYRKQALARNGYTAAVEQRLISAGMLKRDRAGRISITVDGKNNADRDAY